MARQPKSDFVLTEDSRPDQVELPQIETPVIDIQDLEHNPGPETRMSNKGVKIEPRVGSTDERTLVEEDEDVLHTLEEIEKSLRGQLPG